MKYNLTIRIDADAGDVLIIPTLRLTPPQAAQLAELLDKYVFTAVQAPAPNTTPESADYAASPAAPGRRTRKPHARP